MKIFEIAEIHNTPKKMALFITYTATMQSGAFQVTCLLEAIQISTCPPRPCDTQKSLATQLSEQPQNITTKRFCHRPSLSVHEKSNRL